MIRVAKTEGGLVRGQAAGDTYVSVFKGIPFAAPPVGKNRWRVPQPVESWEGVRECYEFAPSPMQNVKDMYGIIYHRDDVTSTYANEWHIDPDLEVSEDCLYLNIWTPAKTTEDKLPVMVWIYGGGLQGGYPGEMEFDGERIATRGVILVSIAYRTNAFAWLAHPEITAECGGKHCTNFGLFDQKAGIDWVERNIANFGGEPENVTIFGQSAGGRSVVSQIVSPLNRGSCIKRAITQSSTGLNFALGAHGADYYTLEEAEQAGVRFFDLLGVKTLEEARAVDAWTVLQKCDEFRSKRLGTWQFVVDGDFLPDQPANLLADGKFLDIPVMTGSTTNEHFDVIRASSLEEFERNARTLYGEYADEFLELCDFKCGDLEKVLANCKVSGSPFGSRLLTMRCVDAGRPAWLYVFDPEIPGPDHPGVFHSSDLWFVFETLQKCWRPFRGKHYDLARQVCNYWTNFAKTGDPNGLDDDGTPMPKWEPFTEDYSQPIIFEDTVHMGDWEMPECRKGMYRLAADKLWRKK